MYDSCMPRVARIVVPGIPHHVTQRGNNRQDVFFVDDDRRNYLHILRDAGAKFGIDVLGYCLMTNHVHLIVTPHTEEALAKALGRTHFLYAQYVNELHGRSGHLWQSRFYSCPMDDDHFWKAMRYVEQNPVRGGLARTARDYPWSSARAHLGDGDESGLISMQVWRDRMDARTWRNLLQENLDEATVSQIRLQSRTGRPLGSDSFLSKLEAMLGRRIRALPIGRQKGWRKQHDHATDSK